MRAYAMFREGGFELRTQDGVVVRWSPEQWEYMLSARKRCKRILEDSSAHIERGIEIVPDVPDPREVDA